MATNRPYRLFGVAPATADGARIATVVARALGACEGYSGLVRVSGNVVVNVRSGGPFTPELPNSDSQVSACPYAKISISTTEGLGRVLIDCDSQIVLPGRCVCGVEILAPATWGEPTPQSSLTGIVWDVRGAVQICPVEDSGEPLGRLTEFTELEAPNQATFVRPRGCRRVAFGSLSVSQAWELWAGAPGVGVQVGVLIVAANSVDAVELVPGITHLRNSPFANRQQLVLTWEICGL